MLYFDPEVTDDENEDRVPKYTYPVTKENKNNLNEEDKATQSILGIC